MFMGLQASFLGHFGAFVSHRGFAAMAQDGFFMTIAFAAVNTVIDGFQIGKGQQCPILDD